VEWIELLSLDWRTMSGIASTKAEKIEREPLQSTGKQAGIDFPAFSGNVTVTASANVAAILRFSWDAFGLTIDFSLPKIRDNLRI
jgi:hypothetical protein